MRGETSERIADERLNRLTYVNRTIGCPNNSSHDMNGCDIRVSFKMKEFAEIIGEQPSITNCKVQVKSSIQNVLNFMNKFGDTYMERREELARQKIVVLSARSPEEGFSGEFRKQVKYINSFHKNNNK